MDPVCYFPNPSPRSLLTLHVVRPPLPSPSWYHLEESWETSPLYPNYIVNNPIANCKVSVTWLVVQNVAPKRYCSDHSLFHCKPHGHQKTLLCVEIMNKPDNQSNFNITFQANLDNPLSNQLSTPRGAWWILVTDKSTVIAHEEMWLPISHLFLILLSPVPKERGGPADPFPLSVPIPTAVSKVWPSRSCDTMT